MSARLVVGQLNLIASDLAATIAFYRLLGLTVEEIDLPGWRPHHASATMPDGFRLEFDSSAFARQWNPGFGGQAGNTGCVVFFSVEDREDVDRLFWKMTGAGYGSQKAPEDAFWGARYAIVEDPDGNGVGIMSRIDPARRHAPPPISDFAHYDERICSTLRWKDVVLPPSVTPADVDTLIFADMVRHWRKVARIVASALTICEARSIPLSAEVIAARIQELAETGRLEGAGNLTMWRHSEVRLPQK